MNEKQVLKINAYPQMVQEFAKANFNLKVLAAASLGLVFLCLSLVIYMVRRGPVVIAIEGNGEVSKIEQKITDVQIVAAAREYVLHRYSWDDISVSAEVKKAEFFIAPNLVTSFERSLNETIKYVREKKVRQRVYPRTVDVNLKDKQIAIQADRFTEFDGLKAATDMRLNLSFTVGERTVTNPWGVYIVKEQEGGSR
jgi:hypothetical protein